MALGGPNSSLLYLWGCYQEGRAKLLVQVAGERTRDIGYKLKQDTPSGYKEKGFSL